MTVIHAAHNLSDILEAENAALTAMDLAAATALLPAKQAATAALVAVHGAAVMTDSDVRSAAERLRALVACNRTLLERAMLAQDRILSCIARAMPPAIAQGGRYGARGANVTRQTLPPVALSARA